MKFKVPELLRRKPKPEPVTHDYSERYWGHDYAITEIKNGGQEIRMTGWGHNLNPGDFIIIQNNSIEPGANPTTRYQIKSIEYQSNPRDMWFGWFTFAPRTS